MTIASKTFVLLSCAAVGLASADDATILSAFRSVSAGGEVLNRLASGTVSPILSTRVGIDSGRRFIPPGMENSRSKLSDTLTPWDEMTVASEGIGSSSYASRSSQVTSVPRSDKSSPSPIGTMSSSVELSNLVQPGAGVSGRNVYGRAQSVWSANVMIKPGEILRLDWFGLSTLVGFGGGEFVGTTSFRLGYREAGSGDDFTLLADAVHTLDKGTSSSYAGKRLVRLDDKPGTYEVVFQVDVEAEHLLSSLNTFGGGNAVVAIEDFSLSVIPTPAAVALLGLAGLATTTRRRG